MDLDDRIRKIVGYKTWPVRKKVDALLEMDAHAYTNLGTDSSSSEKKKTKSNSRKIYKAITQISPSDGYTLEAHMMEKELNL